MAKLFPVGAVQRAGASASRRRCRSHGINDRTALSRASGLRALSARTPTSIGASQSSRVATNAASDRSGKALSRVPRKAARSRRAAVAELQGKLASPSRRTRSARARAIRAGSGLSRISSRTVSRPRRVRRLARRRPEPVSSRRSSISNWLSKTTSSEGSSGAASRILSRRSPPPSSATASQGSRAIASVGSRKAPRPETS